MRFSALVLARAKLRPNHPYSGPGEFTYTLPNAASIYTHAALAVQLAGKVFTVRTLKGPVAGVVSAKL